MSNHEHGWFPPWIHDTCIESTQVQVRYDKLMQVVSTDKHDQDSGPKRECQSPKEESKGNPQKSYMVPSQVNGSTQVQVKSGKSNQVRRIGNMTKTSVQNMDAQLPQERSER